ncbi:zinc finger MYM-type protein 2 isoform X2 [Cyprinodon tularosa]|uniref:zinc finger MYM-type protein 2 isoform X2 n=1 Tax=Cyprinodon tularosa TaxID=77115 RepID=UPI0018E23CCE|nr:zinc finger MYM-type protein 2 isoform X2 [Cyprinodon tularosa]
MWPWSLVLLQGGGLSSAPALLICPPGVDVGSKVVALAMDGETEPNPVMAEEKVELLDATPSSRQPTPPPAEAAGEEVSMETGEEATKEGGTEDDDDDVVLVEEEAERPASSQDESNAASAEQSAVEAPDAAEEDAAAAAATPSKSPESPPSSNASMAAVSQKPPTTAPEPIVIDDEEDCEQKESSSLSPLPPGDSSASHSPGELSSKDPDSEIRISSVTTLGPSSQKTYASNTPTHPDDSQADINLMITSVTSLQGEAAAVIEGVENDTEENGLQISSAFSLNPETPSARSTTSFNPGRGSGSASQLIQNGEAGTHKGADSWISQSASVPRSQKQTGVDSPSPATSLPKPAGQSSTSTSSSGSQTQPRTVKVTCANCKKPLKKGQTAYQRKGSSHLFCSTTCLSAFSHKPTPKKTCTMCKKDITHIKGTIVAQVDSSESFQEFCTTGCLGAYENKHNPPKTGIKNKCTVCGKLTEIRHEVSFKNVTHKICSDTCFNVYRKANGLIMNCCEQCGDYLPSRASANHFLLVDGQQKRFCCQNCIRDYKQAHSKLATCMTCKTLIKTGEVLQTLGANGTMSSYCSVSCMNKGKLTSLINKEPTCDFCKRSSLPQYQATLPEGSILNFCSSQCVTKFQNASLQTTTNGQMPLSNSSVQLKCNYCRGAFSLKPEILEWQDKVYQFCSKTCCEDYKKLHCIVTLCEYCQEEKTLHEMVKFSGVKRPFCSEGCKLLFKQDFIRRLGLKCVSCNHCNQLCKRGITRQLGGLTRDFCSEACAKKFNDWYYKAARCDCCKVQGNLTESVMWRSEMKHFCDQECLLRFYCQQNDPIMVTQKGPENTTLGIDVQAAKTGLVNQSAVTYSSGGVIRDVKNKAVLCKPLTLTKATYCKPHMQSKHLQTDVDDGVKREYIPVPIPVPVFIPMPMNMYAQVTPTPLSMPVPVPVPVFLPTTLQGAEEIIQTMKDLKAEMPSNSMEADVIIKDDEKPYVKELIVKEDCVKGESSSSSSEEEEEVEEEKYDPDLDLEADFPQASEPVPALEGMDEDMGFSLPPVLAEEKEDLQESVPRPQPRKLGSKRRALEDLRSSSPSHSSRNLEGRSLPLKSRYGINAWKRWALSLSDQSEDAKEKDTSKPTRSKSNLLTLKAAELNVALSRFVREACRPNGERYSPDSILYLCLGIQQHLHAKGRKDDLFSDPCYQQFGEELNKVLKDWQPSVLPDGSLWGRVEEQSLWSGQHLGEQSPASLLRSLVYLNTKYFGLRTVEQHLRLSFANVYGPDTIHPVSKESSVCIRVPSISQDHHREVPTASRKRKRKLDEEEEEENEGSGGSSVHCPVKKHECRLYELYRSKCPPLLWERLDVFYVQPDPTCSPADPVWFSSTPLERQILESLLTRVLLVRDIYTDKPLLEEDEEEDSRGEEDGGE